MVEWIRWRIGERFSVWHRLADPPRDRTLVFATPDGIVVAPLDSRRAVILLAGNGRARCGTPIPAHAEIETADVAPRVDQCVFCLRLSIASTLPPAAASSSPPRERASAPARKRRFDALPGARA